MIIAQVSDIHAAPDNDNLSRLARALSWLDFIKPDALVLTGDVIDNNWSEGYEKVSACVHNRTWPTFVLPGNADDSTGIRAMSGLRPQQMMRCILWRSSAGYALSGLTQRSRDRRQAVCLNIFGGWNIPCTPAA
ncbi:metallophosphoesterase family protein [Nissabacter archeti]|uniref:metallophosphoesterase family protein n=1 Tax=Nissabacter archeti TaxID=1917880 RepID=UPI0030B82921